MKEHRNREQLSRRTFLKTAGIGTGAAGLAAAVLTPGAPARSEQPRQTGRPEAGYRETEHVRRVYDLSRF